MNLVTIGAFFVGALFGLAVTDFSDARLRVEVVAVEAPCDPAKTQVLYMDNSEQITQVLDRGVNCVVVMR